MSKLYKERRTPDYATDDDSKVITKWILAISLVVAVFYVFGFLAINNNNKEESSNTENITATTRPSDEETVTVDIPDESEEEKEELELELYASEGLPYYYVISVTDGDTIRVNYNGRSTPVRMIGIDTPETVHPNKPVECYGPESSEYARRHLSNKSVQLEFDNSQGMTDKYGRLLAYVYVDGVSYNFHAIKDGYAYEYTYNSAYKYQKEFMFAESEAESENRGLWSPSTCNGRH